ncbi:hypothetical protein EOD39_21231 [Acipenser ruthenus]|uniref:Uncharacterized protein n=1 Tax=Acipenser ruthenus TaxID=7906 RepID=A0A444UTA4_ACIRT|nr:hypothetical protein EOD39_21231 [Acipenser ruthenus]
MAGSHAGLIIAADLTAILTATVRILISSASAAQLQVLSGIAGAWRRGRSEIIKSMTPGLLVMLGRGETPPGPHTDRRMFTVPIPFQEPTECLQNVYGVLFQESPAESWRRSLTFSSSEASVSSKRYTRSTVQVSQKGFQVPDQASSNFTAV